MRDEEEAAEATQAREEGEEDKAGQGGHRRRAHTAGRPQGKGPHLPQ